MHTKQRTHDDTDSEHTKSTTRRRTHTKQTRTPGKN